VESGRQLIGGWRAERRGSCGGGAVHCPAGELDRGCEARQPAQPLINLTDERLRESGYIRMDETPVQVLMSEKRPPPSITCGSEW
jgi:hypothetical protein